MSQSFLARKKDNVGKKKKQKLVLIDEDSEESEKTIVEDIYTYIGITEYTCIFLHFQRYITGRQLDVVN